ncbi:CHASE3 domain-containing protein [Roseateles violae]|uniref:histidine kinase n=1 Tax=Roseateles violae TaxID=3058042 RepID=A0ABT8DW21_9BURK|nr:CHASE3 domain-containing protein [Pelomonas sp. PFR6]MDN3920489.1 CHASE3 domain-containing protein [Pelomonas sp. PFR6]
MKLAALTARLQQSAFAFPLAILVAGLMLAISETAYYGADSQLSTLVTMGQARMELVRLVARVTDAEAGQRGYLLTGRPEYLEPYRFASVDTVEGLETLRKLYARLGHHEAEAQRLRIAASINTKLSELGEELRLYDAGRQDSVRELLLTDIGRNHMDAIRGDAETLLASENRHIAAGIGNVFDTLLLNRIGVAAMTAISLLVVAMFLRQGRQLERERSQQQLLLQGERDRLEQEVLRRTAELTELARHLQTAREDERARLARDLHDELGALLTAAKLDVARIRPRLQQSSELQPRLAHLTETLNAGIALKRRIIEDLRPSTLDQLGLAPALEILCREFGTQAGLTVRTELSPVPLAPSSQLSVFRLVQEALNNIAKYAQASEVRVGLSSEGNRVRVSVADNGRGFDPRQIAIATHGLLGMRFRVEAERGELRVASTPGKGTLIEACLPSSAPQPEAATATS